MHRVRLAVAALAVAGIGAAGVGTAFASTSAPAKTPAPATAVAPATGGNVQQGNQNTPDIAASAEKPGTEVADGPDQADTGTASPEVSGPSDGPGGHQDSAGNVDNQSEGNN